MAEISNISGDKFAMITNTAAYTIVVIAYITFAIATWFMFSTILAM